METISFEDFKKIEIKIGTIVSAQRIENADKLLKLMFDMGPSDASEAGSAGSPVSGEKVQILAGIAQFYEPDFLIGKQMPVVVNLEPRLLRGFHSNGMILAADNEGRPVILNPAEPVPPGSIVK